MSRITRRVKQAGVYFVTTDTWERREIFLKPDPARIVLEQIVECRNRGFYKLHAFVLMPEHLHLLITPSEEVSIEKAIMMIKGGSSYRIKKELLYSFPIWMKGYHDRWIRDTHEFLIRRQVWLKRLATMHGVRRVENIYSMHASMRQLQGLKPTYRRARLNVAPKGVTHQPARVVARTLEARSWLMQRMSRLKPRPAKPPGS